MFKVTVRAPATTANLGPGFDCLGMALELFAEVAVEEAEGLVIHAEGGIPQGRDNLVYRALEAVYREQGLSTPGFRIWCQNSIPPARGLGSSAAAIAGGLVAANHLLGQPFSQEKLLQLGSALEGHPDNMAAALFGGCQLVLREEGRWLHSSVPLPPGLKAVLFIPDFEMPTIKSRSLLSPQVPRADAIYNMGRVALLVKAFVTGELHLLRLATQDRLHQPARRTLFPAMDRLFDAALEAGALGVFLSGGGSSILALTQGEGQAEAIAQALKRRGEREGVAGQTLLTQPTPRGTQIVESTGV